MALQTGITNIQGTSYSVETDLLSLASTYFNADLDTVKSGLFGYMTESMAHIAKEGIFHRNMLYNEQFLNSANMISSIYNFASQQNYLIPDATPSNAVISFAIKKSTVAHLSGINGGAFIISRDTTIMMDNFPFIFPFDIEVTLDAGAVSAKYVVDHNDSITANILTKYSTNPFIRTWVQNVVIQNVGEDYIYLILDIYQASKSYNEWEVMTSNVIEQIKFDYKFTDQLTSFNVYYNTKLIPKYFSTTDVPTDLEYAFWTQPNSSEISIFFSPIDGRFRPHFGSTVGLILYSSQGSAGNFTFTGGISFKFSESMLLQYGGLEQERVTISIIQQPGNGADKPSLLQIKQDLLHLQRTRDNLITEYDVNSYFNFLAKTTLNQNSDITFRKKRDDVLSRLFGGYLLLFDKQNNLIPSNTSNIHIPLSNLESNGWTYKPGSIVIYDKIIKDVRFLDAHEYPESYINQPNSIVYALPFLMDVKLDPMPRIGYYNTYVDQTYSLSLKTFPYGGNRQFMVGGVSVQRNPLLSDILSISSKISVSGTAINYSTDIKVLCMIKEGIISKGWVELVYDAAAESFVGSLTTNNVIDNGRKLEYVDTLLPTNGSTPMAILSIGGTVSLDILVLYNGSYSTAESTTVAPFDAIPISIYSSFKAVALASSIEPVVLFRSLNAVLSSNISVKDDSNFMVSEIPLIGYSYFYNSLQYNELMTVIDNYFILISDNLKRLENNTGVDIKFFNTYGLSYEFDSLFTTLDIDISITLNVQLTPTLELSIRDVIDKFVLSTNYTVERHFSISNLISQLENTFVEIDHIVFNTVNGVNTQRIKYLFNSGSNNPSSVNSASTVPEFISTNIVTLNFL